MFLLAVTVLSLLCTTVVSACNIEKHALNLIYLQVSQDATSSLTIALPVPDDEVCYPPIYLAGKKNKKLSCETRG